MKKVMMLALGGLITVATFGQDRSVEAANRAVQVEGAQQARLQQARIKQIRVDQPDLTQQRIQQARLQEARIKDARLKDKRIKDARLKEKRIKDARLKNKRIKDAREDAAGDNDQVNSRRYHKARIEAMRKRLANQDNKS